MRTLSFLLALFRLNVQHTFALRGAFLLQAIFMILNDLIVFTVWIIIFHSVDTIRGWSLNDMALLWGVLTAGYGIPCAFANGAKSIGRAVREGELDSFLTQPKNTLLYLVGSRGSPSGWGDIFASLVFFSCTTHTTLSSLPLIVGAVLVSAVIYTATVVAVYSLTFWCDAIEDLGEQLRNYLITMSSYPTDIFPWSLRMVLFTVFPAGIMGTLPVAAVREGSSALLLTASAVALLYSYVAYRLFYGGLKRYTSGSRMSVRAG